MTSKKDRKHQPSDSAEIFHPDTGNAEKLELFASNIPAGFPSPAEDFLEKRLDLNDYLIQNKSATFLVKVRGNSMEDAGIRDGDILIIDRSLEAYDGKVVLGVLNGEFTVKRISKKKNKLFLVPENDQYESILVTEEMDFKIWGVVTFSLHRL